MSDKTDAQIEREKQAVAAMANAKANMSTALERIATLESALRTAANDLGRAKHYVGDQCGFQQGSSFVGVKTWLGDRQAAALKALP